MTHDIWDYGNGFFEWVGAVLVWLNVQRLMKDRVVRGVDWRVTAFWAAWGVWNLFCYPHLNQWVSFMGGLLIVAANAVWVYLVLLYRRQDARPRN